MYFSNRQQISLAPEERRNRTKLYNPMTVAQLQRKYPFVPWFRYLNNILAPNGQIKQTDRVIVRVPSFLESLPKLLIKTPKRVLANYMIGRVVQESSDIVGKVVRGIEMNYAYDITETEVEPLMYSSCINFLSKSLFHASGALYVRKIFDNNTKRQVENLVIEVRQSFDRMLEKVCSIIFRKILQTTLETGNLKHFFL